MTDHISWIAAHGDRVTVWQDDAGLWRWTVRASGNNEVVGSGEAHPRKASALSAAERHHPRVSDE